MQRLGRSQSGQAVFSEYMMVVFLVIAGLTAISLYVQRGIQARLHDAHRYMIDSIANSSVCGPNCVLAAGGSITYEYEPYYTKTGAVSQQSSNPILTASVGGPHAVGDEGIYSKFSNDATQMNSNTGQLPAACAGTQHVATRDMRLESAGLLKKIRGHMSTCRGQSLIEYTMLIGVITLVFMYMGTGIKRGLQSLVKVTADQIGNQENADQDFNDTQSGYMVQSNTTQDASSNKRIIELGSQTGGYITNTLYDDTSETVTNSITNGGFSPGGD